MKNFTLKILFSLTLFFSIPSSAQNSTHFIDNELETLASNEKLSTADLSWELTNSHVSSTTGVLHAYYQQVVGGISVYNTQSSIHIKDGMVLHKNNQFIKDAIAKVTTVQPSISAIQALRSGASQLGYKITEPVEIVENTNRSNKTTTLTDSGISKSPIPVQLMYFLDANNALRLVWDLSIQSNSEHNWWRIRLDANSGALLDKNNYMLSCKTSDLSAENISRSHRPSHRQTPAKNSEAPLVVGSYEVFAVPIESPYYGSRTLEVDPFNPNASPFGWHDTDGIAGPEFTVTRGNNVNAFDDGDGGYQPDGGAALNFSGYDFDETWTGTNQYADASITQLFYTTNMIHDVLYQYGFTEDAGNFQENNYGNGGLDGDSIIAEGQKGPTCNAFFSSPPDGAKPTLETFVCNDKDGNFDNVVVYHEVGHGTSLRLIGGPGNSSCLSNIEQMGEGWSDWFGIVMTIEPGDTGEDLRAIGTYLFDQGANGDGVREFPYTTNLADNPHTYGDLPTAGVPNGVGSIWTAMLWEMTWALIDEHGFDSSVYSFTGDINQDAGNIQAIALITEALKLTPCGPGFVDARDAILMADEALYGGENECALWTAFAKRGLGFSANQGVSSSITDGTVAFDIPPTSCVLNTDDQLFSQSILVYPNPSFGELQISNPGNYALITAKVIDINGREIKNFDVSNQTNISLSDVSSGVYFIQIISEKFTTTKRVIKY